jgi:DNA polymerase-3 subunit delta
LITVLTGGNVHAINTKLAEIKRTFSEQYGNAGVESISGEQLQPEQLSSLLGGVTLFASDRLVVIRGISENKPAAEQLLATLNTVSDQTHLVLVEEAIDKRTALYKTLKKEADFHEFAELDEATARNWLKNLVKEEGGTIDAESTRLLVRSVGTNQSRLSNEIQKLIAYSPSITKESIELLVDKRPEDTIFQLLDYALSGKTDQALSVLAGLEQAHEDPFQIASMLVWQANILAVVQSAHATADAVIAKDAKINPFVVRKTKDLVRRINTEKLNTILDAVAECDTMLKSSSANPWHVLERTILAV